MKAIEQQFHGLRFIMLYRVILSFKSVDEIHVLDHLNVNERYLAALSCSAIYFRILYFHVPLFLSRTYRLVSETGRFLWVLLARCRHLVSILAPLRGAQALNMDWNFSYHL